MECYDDLRFATHLAFYHEHWSGDEASLYWQIQAQILHYCRVSDAIRDLHFRFMVHQRLLTEGPYRQQILFGCGRRSRFIWDALRNVFGLAHPTRQEPLTQDECFTIERALNDVYIHSRGLFDNLAWACLYVLPKGNQPQISPATVGLFHSRFTKLEGLSWIGEVVAPFRDWERSFKSRRDPVAHRIPLSVPPAIVTLEEAAQRSTLYENWWEASERTFETMRNRTSTEQVALAQQAQEALFNQMESVGTFFPYMSIDPSLPPIPIYPTVVEDIGFVVEIASRILEPLADKTKESET